VPAVVDAFVQAQPSVQARVCADTGPAGEPIP